MKKFRIVLIASGFICQIGHANMRQYITFNANACDKLTYINQVTEQTWTMQPIDGHYTLYDWGEDNGSTDPNYRLARNFTCYTNSKTSDLTISSLQGQFEHPFSKTAGVWLAVDGIPLPCNLSQPAYYGALIESVANDPNSCTKSTTTFDGDTYSVSPVITLPSNWQTLTYTFAEWNYPYGNVYNSVQLPMTITRQPESSALN